MTAEHRVDELRLVIGAAAGGGELRAEVERFARRALERCGDLLESRFPGRLFFVRRLPLRWALTDDRLADPAEIDRLAEELARTVETLARSPSPATGSVAVFEDEADWQARFLAARARGAGREEWFFETLRRRGPGLADLGRRGLGAEVLERLRASGELPRVLAAAAPEELGAFAAALGLPAPPGGGPAAAAAAGALPRREARRLERRARELANDLGAGALRVLLFVEGRRLDPAAPAAAVLEAVDRAMAAAGTRQAAPAAPPPASGPAAAPAGDLGGAATSGRPIATGYGGLFYLVSLALELQLNEHLWQACLPEGQVLAAALATLLDGDAADPAPGLLGGVDRPLAGFELTDEQQREVSRASLESLGRALPRRGLAALPETVLAIHDDRRRRLLVLAPRASPFPLFAWPATSAESLGEAIGCLLDAWPRSAPPVVAQPGLAAADPRLRASGDALPASALLVPEAGSAAATALLAQLAGGLSHLFASRAGASPASAGELVDAWLRFPAELVVERDSITAVAAAENVRPELRRAGLDRDPGWVPWLRKTVRIRFEDV